MSSKRILGIAGAAMIGTLAGTGAAHAVLGTGAEGTTGVPTFARESFTDDPEIVPSDGSGGKYYQAAAHTTASGELDIRIPFGLEVAATENAVVTVDLEDLVFTGLPPTVTFQTVADPPVDIAVTAATVVSGGLRGDRRAQFLVDLDATPLTRTTSMLLQIGRIGINTTMAGIEDGVGTITIMSTNPDVVPVQTRTVTLTKVVKVRPALALTVRPREQIADSQEGFTAFKPGSGVGLDRLAASVGDVHLGLATTTETFFNAQRGTGEIGAVTDLITPMTSVTFNGNREFVEKDNDGDDKVYLGDDDCSPEQTSLEDTKGVLKATLADISGSSPTYLCLKVDGATEIPDTEAYTLSINYVSVHGDDALHPPQNVVGMDLGSITREGSTVLIPYLTSNRKYNQRVVVVNRSGRSVPYSMTFTTTDDTTATPQRRASGTLPVGRTVWLVHEDLVTFAVEGRDTGGHGSGEITVASGLIEVATVITNREDGSTDTVVLDPQ